MLKILTARPRLFLALGVGLVCFALLPDTWLPRTRLLVAWDTLAVFYVVASLQLFLTETMERIPSDAERQQEGEWTLFGMTMAVLLACFGAIFGEFSATKDMHGSAKDLHILLIGVTLFASWMMLHTIFCFRYAHEYYERTQNGFVEGLEFPKQNRPDYMDFAYFSLVLGMTFQVSDVQITSGLLRRLAALHGLIAFFFNTVILALTVNIGASLM